VYFLEHLSAVSLCEEEYFYSTDSAVIAGNFQPSKGILRSLDHMLQPIRKIYFRKFSLKAISKTKIGPQDFVSSIIQSFRCKLLVHIKRQC